MVSSRLIVYSSTCPYQNIALDEALFVSVIKYPRPTCRIWINSEDVVYLGIGKKVKQDVHLSACQSDNVPVIRRFSGGGTVLHDAFTLNYTFALPLEDYPECVSIQKSYYYILDLLNRILKPLSVTLNLSGNSDWTVNGYKISGNAQSRRKNVILHHGTLLLRCFPEKVGRYLAEPPHQPEYREKRSHMDFLTSFEELSVSLDLKSFVKLLRVEWPNFKLENFSSKESLLAEQFVREKYSLDTWNLKI
jgi:lipoate-protein ligase A